MLAIITLISSQPPTCTIVNEQPPESRPGERSAWHRPTPCGLPCKVAVPVATRGLAESLPSQADESRPALSADERDPVPPGGKCAGHRSNVGHNLVSSPYLVNCSPFRLTRVYHKRASINPKGTQRGPSGEARALCWLASRLWASNGRLRCAAGLGWPRESAVLGPRTSPLAGSPLSRLIRHSAPAVNPLHQSAKQSPVL